MRIGQLHIDVPVLLAPMAAVTDLPFRTVCEEHGAGLTITEFLSASALTYGDSVATSKLTASRGGRSFGVQIYGRVEEELAHAAQMAVGIGASLIDINMGCPAKRVVAGACGSALMKEPELAARLVRAVIAVVPERIPVTVKHRAGWDATHKNAPEFACAMVEAGARMITVHGRTRTQGYAGDSDLGIIRQVRDAVPASVPVVGNGDVVCIDTYKRMREQTGCDAVMIGRGAWGNPWLFRRIRELEASGRDSGPPSMAERIATFQRHLELIFELRAGPKMVHEVRKAVAWYAKGLRGCNELRKRVWTMTEPEHIRAEAMAFFRAAAVCDASHEEGARHVA